jgi:pyruvate dehydrogenase E1 component alpha subunit
MAQIWKLPILYICENNQYGMGTDFRRVSAVTDFTIMGSSYGIEGKQVNGMDVLDVYETVSDEVNRIRKNNSPGFLEIRTYRYKGHSMSDPARYRTREELNAYREQDPLLLLKTRMINNNQITEEQFEAIDHRLKKLCDDAVKFADKSEEPALKSLYEDVYA